MLIEDLHEISKFNDHLVKGENVWPHWHSMQGRQDVLISVTLCCQSHIDELVQERYNTNALAME